VLKVYKFQICLFTPPLGDFEVLGLARDPLEWFSFSTLGPPIRLHHALTPGSVSWGLSGGEFLQGRRYLSPPTDQRALFSSGFPRARSLTNGPKGPGILSLIVALEP
jgi:hypothetical protein